MIFENSSRTTLKALRTHLQGKSGTKRPMAKAPKVTPTGDVLFPHKFKTVLCKNYSRGLSCPFGKKCNFAHGQEQLKKFNDEDEEVHEY